MFKELALLALLITPREHVQTAVFLAVCAFLEHWIFLSLAMKGLLLLMAFWSYSDSCLQEKPMRCFWLPKSWRLQVLKARFWQLDPSGDDLLRLQGFLVTGKNCQPLDTVRVLGMLEGHLLVEKAA